MDRKNWPWRKKISNTTTNIMSTNPALHAAFDVPHLNSGSVSPATTASPSFEARSSKPAISVSAEKKKPLFHLENANALDTLALKEQAEQKVISLTEKLEDAERDLISKEAMVKQHSKVAEEAVSGWEKSGVEVVSLKQELAASMQQRVVEEGRSSELEGALKGCMKQLRQAQGEQQQRIQEALEKKMQEWSKVRAEMEGAEKELNQRMLAAEAQSCAMAKSLEERARAIAEWQEGKAKAEMEAGLLQVKLESQSTEMAALKYELRVLSKELEIRNQENECSRKAADSAHKQHLEDVKKITKLDSECQRLRMLVRKRLPGPAAIAQMKMEVEKSEQSKRRRSLGAANSCAQISSHQGTNTRENATSYNKDMADKLLAMEEETKTLKETLAKKTAELQSARQMCAWTANKLSVAEEQLDSLQGTPTSVRSTQTCALESFLRNSQDVDAAKAEKLDDEVSCAESWASALILELAHFKKAKQSMDLSSVTSIVPDGLNETPVEPSIDNIGIPKQASPSDNSPSAQDYVILKTLASKDAQLQSANLMCKDAMAKLALAEVKLGGTWMSENPKSNVEESVNSVGEAHGIMSKLDRILDDMRIAVASVGDMTDDDNSDHGLSSPLVDGQPKSVSAVDASSDLVSLKEQVGMQAEEISEKQMQVDTLEAAKAELQMQLHVAEEELNLIKPELEKARMQIEDLEASALNLQNEQRQVLVDEETKRGKLEAQLETEQTKVSKLESSIASLTIELADRRKEHEVAIAKCDALDLKLQSYMGREHSMPGACRFEGELDARARKEREVAAAKEKLTECQRTILVLGKQLTAFSTPSSASFDCSAMPLHYEHLDSSQDQDYDHAHKVRARVQQRRPLPYNSVNPRDGSTCLPANPITHHGSDSTKPVQLNASHYSKPRRIQSDLSYRTGSTNHVPGRLQYSVAEHLLMDDGVSSFYDSLPESPESSPSSQYTPPSDKFRNEGHRNGQARGGVRMSLAKSLESAAARAAEDDKRGNGRRDGGIKTNVAVADGGMAKTGGGGGGGGGGGKGNKGFSRFFSRSKK